MADTKLSALTELAATPADADEVYIRDVSEAAADESKRITIANLLAGGAADFPMKSVVAITRWTMPGWYISGTTPGTTGGSAGRIFYTPIFVEETTTYIRIGIEVTTGVATTADLRIFNWDNGLPGSLVLAAGTVDVTSTGKKEIVISQQLTRGYYFLALRCGAASVGLTASQLSPAPVPPIAGTTTTGQPKVQNVIPSVVDAYADPAPAPDTVMTVNKAFVILREN